MKLSNGSIDMLFVNRNRTNWEPGFTRTRLTLLHKLNVGKLRSTNMKYDHQVTTRSNRNHSESIK
jgi:hypothetical protein